MPSAPVPVPSHTHQVHTRTPLLFCINGPHIQKRGELQTGICSDGVPWPAVGDLGLRMTTSGRNPLSNSHCGHGTWTWLSKMKGDYAPHGTGHGRAPSLPFLHISLFRGNFCMWLGRNVANKAQRESKSKHNQKRIGVTTLYEDTSF